MRQVLALAAVLATVSAGAATSAPIRVAGRIRLCIPDTGGESFEQGVQFYRVFSASEGADEVDIAKTVSIDAGQCADTDAYVELDNRRWAPRRGDKFERALGSAFGKDLGTAKATVTTDFK